MRSSGTVLAASLLLPAVGLALHLLGLRRTLRLLGCDAPARSQAVVSDRARDVAQAVVHAGRKYSVYPVDCLVQSIALCWLLRRQGLAAELRIGARTLTGRFEAHAWVEHGGAAIGEDEDVTRIYHAFEFPSREKLRAP